MKQVCMVVQSHYPSDPRVRRQAETLRKAGYNVDIICLRKSDESVKENFGSITALRIFKTYSQENFGEYIMVSISFLFLAFFKLVRLSFKRSMIFCKFIICLIF